jgi:serine O-acetyltransferase
VYIPKTTGLLHQGLGVVIHPNTIIGEHCVIRQNVSIGTNAKPGQGGLAPSIGDYVMIGAGACVLGNIKIGNKVTIGANAVVLMDVPDNCVAVGVPAKDIRR